MNKLQRGFAGLETLLILVIVAIVGGIGWYVLHTKHQTDKILSKADKISQNTPVKTSPNTKSTNDSQQYLVIKEWGIKIKLADASKVTYTYSAQKGTTISGSEYDSSIHPEIKPEFLQDKSCSLGVGITRSASSSYPSGEVKVGNYYYTLGGGPGACSNYPDTNPDDILKKNVLRDLENHDNYLPA